MYGRYGNDLLNLVLIICGMLLLCIGQFFWIYLFMAVSYVFYGFALFRMMSRNIQARQRELYAFMKLWNPIASFFRMRRTIWKQRKTHRYFRCPKCKQWLRAPRGRGKIQVRCQKCGNEFIKKV